MTQNLHLQLNIDASRKSHWIEKFADNYSNSPEYKFIVDNTVYLTDEAIQESMRVIGTCKELPRQGLFN